MQQKAKNNKILREANRLLELRENVRKKFGENYDAAIAQFVPFVSVELQRTGCPQLSAARVLSRLSTQQQTNTDVKHLVKCAALDVAMQQTSLPLAVVMP